GLVVALSGQKKNLFPPQKLLGRPIVLPLLTVVIDAFKRDTGGNDQADDRGDSFFVGNSAVHDYRHEDTAQNNRCTHLEILPLCDDGLSVVPCLILPGPFFYVIGRLPASKQFGLV